MSKLQHVVALVAAMGLGSSGMAMAEPLASGKPAGVKQAQLQSIPPLVWIALAGVAAAGIAAAASSGNSPSTFTTAPVTTG